MGIGDLGLGPIPNHQSPIPNPQSPFIYINLKINLNKFKNMNKNKLIKFTNNY